MTLVFIIILFGFLIVIIYIVFEKIRSSKLIDKTFEELKINDDPGEAQRREMELLERTAYKQNKKRKIDYERPLDITETDEVDDNGVLMPPENL